jgi:hypothetical protein
MLRNVTPAHKGLPPSGEIHPTKAFVNAIYLYICIYFLAFSCVRAAHAGRTHGIPMGFLTVMAMIFCYRYGIPMGFLTGMVGIVFATDMSSRWDFGMRSRGGVWNNFWICGMSGWDLVRGWGGRVGCALLLRVSMRFPAPAAGVVLLIFKFCLFMSQ